MTIQREKYDDETKAAAIADVFILGYGATSAKYGIPDGTLRSWKSRTNAVATLKKDNIGQLIAEYLTANLQALTAQAYVASTPEYINRQPASDLAILHGVFADKSIRLLEAVTNANATNEDTGVSRRFAVVE